MPVDGDGGMDFGFKVETAGAVRMFRTDVPRQVPYALAQALTGLGMDGRAALQRQLPVSFDRPTPFTVRGVFTKGATKSRLVAEVYFPSSAPQAGRGQREFIRPGAMGAFKRSQKKTEFLLTRLGILPAGWVTVPGKGAKLDSYGNLSGRIYAQIVNVLQLKARVVGGRNVAERSQARAKKLGVAAEFFAVGPGINKLAPNGGSLPPGVWKHLPGRRLSQILKFVGKAAYKQRLDVRKEVQGAVTANLPRRWDAAFSNVAAKFAASPRGRR